VLNKSEIRKRLAYMLLDEVKSDHDLETLARLELNHFVEGEDCIYRMVQELPFPLKQEAQQLQTVLGWQY
jgi:hypothetical protein